MLKQFEKKMKEKEISEKHVAFSVGPTGDTKFLPQPIIKFQEFAHTVIQQYPCPCYNLKILFSRNFAYLHIFLRVAQISCYKLA